MSDDSYRSFDQLRRHQAPGSDYRVRIRNVGSQISIIAPHGGRIEPRTSEIAVKIARNDYNCYLFEGIRERDNGCLHITSHRFDEPGAIEMLAASQVVVAVHACTGTDGRVYLGGRDGRLKQLIAAELKAAGINACGDHPRFQGVNPDNICNRGATRKGVQLEISRDLRDDPANVERICHAVRAALGKNEIRRPC